MWPKYRSYKELQLLFEIFSLWCIFNSLQGKIIPDGAVWFALQDRFVSAVNEHQGQWGIQITKNVFGKYVHLIGVHFFVLVCNAIYLFGFFFTKIKVLGIMTT